MKKELRDQFQVGEWYKDRDGDFVKFKEFSERYLGFTARVRNGEYWKDASEWNVDAFTNGCVTMTTEEMKRFLPKSEWWEEKPKAIGLFPIY